MTAATKLSLISPIEQAPPIGERHGPAFRALGIPSIAHLVHHLPFRHEQEEEETTIDQLQDGQTVAVRGEITDTKVGGYGRRKRFQAVLMDDTGRLDLIWFNQTYLHRRIHPGMRLLIQGQARRKGPAMQISNPKWFAIKEDSPEPARTQERLRPIYPASEHAPSWLIEKAIDSVLDEALPLIADHLPKAYCKDRDFPSLADAYRMMHRPKSGEEISTARRRLAYDELFFLQLAVLRQRLDRATRPASALICTDEIDQRIRSRFPFTLTAGQDEAISDIVNDLGRSHPAYRLIQGEVGSGKTVVALYAMLLAIARGKQAALMAPTELLAEQHHASIGRLLEGSNVRVELLTGSLPQSERESIQHEIESGDIDLVIGTHALLTQGVQFDNLGVAVIDEQHRFGVDQRAALWTKKGESAPHVIVMTATPIPRSLTQTIFGDLDISTIRGVPPGRGAVQTMLCSPANRTEIDTILADRLAVGEQAFIVVPVIEEGAGLRDVRSTLDRLENGPLAKYRLAAIHGQLKRDARQAIMERFRLGQIDALVATTVIEVGVDVPNASLMVIEHAERFGLAQLHQLRGRIGRGANDALCILVAEPTTPDGEARIAALAATNDGFELAEQDLLIRGPGDLAGARQSGAPAMRIADLLNDMPLLALARRDAKDWLERSPRLDRPEEALLARRLEKAQSTGN